MTSTPTDLDKLCNGSQMVTFICTADNIKSNLSWYLNGIEHAFLSTDREPRLSHIVMLMNAEIVEVRPIQGVLNAFDVTAELTTNTSVLDKFGISTVQCRTDTRTSNSNIIELSILGM